MAQIKYVMGTSKIEDINELTGLDIQVEENEDRQKAVIPFESDKKDNKIAIAMGNLKALFTTEEFTPEGYDDIFKVTKYTMELSTGVSVEFESVYSLSTNSLAYRAFAKAMAPFKAKSAPKRTSMASELKAKIKEERARYIASLKNKKAVKSEVSDEAEF